MLLLPLAFSTQIKIHYYRLLWTVAPSFVHFLLPTFQSSSPLSPSQFFLMNQKNEYTRSLEIISETWDQQPQNQREENGKVMTDEQLETLRKQIAVYASICEQLVQMHQHLTLTDGSLGNLYSDLFMTPGGHKISARQRWTPTPVQLRILERIFHEVTGTPSKQKIKEITSELSQHGQISETNVYNWFQNRRARYKRKQAVAAFSTNNAAESEVETEVESPKTKPENLPVPQAKQDVLSEARDYLSTSSLGRQLRAARMAG